ncbi:Phosphatidylserine/phosphatidylglycerophosphate/cardiolipin synthase [Ferrimonas sediminum]|uniref:Phosphatidylserine/phosphatidylglycerophosphate/cardiolipin synthase n=1 Tax=Ferrimonas sediminum TaxID=718193 RepID=A0A1G8NNP6_9GAMM|nr:phospholipase D family protein [Ferrimonas sediminum]SDI81921.1 Phosphatidylserine/phosphatidylglycerophosphate/cardiolipin synthase [Ferrimonas sediminum]
MTLVARILLLALPVVIAGCATSLPQVSKPESYAIAPDTNQQAWESIQALQQAHPGQSGVYPIGDGREAFIARLQAATDAQASIDLQTYIYRDDDTGRAVLWSLWQAAERGVRIRLLLDDMQTSGNDEALAVLHQHPEIQVRLFNPFTKRQWRGLELVGSFDRTNRRMHNKAFIVDNSVAITGGRNIGDEYFDASHDIAFGDFDVLLIGPAVIDISTQFDDYWNSDYAIPVDALVETTRSTNPAEITRAFEQRIDADKKQQQAYIDSLYETELVTHLERGELPLYWSRTRVVADSPHKADSSSPESSLMVDALAEEFRRSNDSLLLVSPYFVPGQAGADNLVAMARRGLKISIITNSLAATDVVAVHSGYRGYRQQLLEAGIALYETKRRPGIKPGSWAASSQASLHAKTMVFDHRTLFVGSFNLDPRSALINTEMGVLFDSPKLAKLMTQSLEKQIPKSTYRLSLEDGELRWHDDQTGAVLSSEPDASVWRRMGAWLMTWLPIEDQL